MLEIYGRQQVPIIYYYHGEVEISSIYNFRDREFFASCLLLKKNWWLEAILTPRSIWLAPETGIFERVFTLKKKENVVKQKTTVNEVLWLRYFDNEVLQKSSMKKRDIMINGK